MGPPAAPGTPGHAGWHELYTSNWENALSFYSELFGWEKADSVDMGSMGIYQLFGKDGTAFGGMMNKPGEMPNPVWTYYFNVDGIEAAAARVKERRGTVLNGPRSEEHTSELQSLMRISYAVFCLKTKTKS